jgi:hypothetical protein
MKTCKNSLLLSVAVYPKYPDTGALSQPLSPAIADHLRV